MAAEFIWYSAPHFPAGIPAFSAAGCSVSGVSFCQGGVSEPFSGGGFAAAVRMD